MLRWKLKSHQYGTFGWKPRPLSSEAARIPQEFLAEVLSDPKDRRAEPHNCHARIEFWKTKHLSFHGHR